MPILTPVTFECDGLIPVGDDSVACKEQGRGYQFLCPELREEKVLLRAPTPDWAAIQDIDTQALTILCPDCVQRYNERNHDVH